MKAFLLLFLFASCEAWWCNGHMLGALIAEIDLKSSAPSSYNLASDTVQVLNGALTHNLSNTFVESACWADDIKDYNMTYLNYAHFRDMPYNPQGLLDTPTPVEDVLWTIGQINQTLTWQTIDTAPLETSFSLRFLIHIIGDMHQPLHCTQMWSDKFPRGDLGGNFFKVTFDYGIKQLHALWDSAVGILRDDLKRPLSQTSWDLLNEYAELMMKENPRSSLEKELAFKDPADWCLQSFEEAIGTVYDGIKQYERPSQEYLDKAWTLIKKQIALSGYRLSDLVQVYY